MNEARAWFVYEAARLQAIAVGAPPKPEDEWDEYDYMMIPRWRALKAALDAVRAGRVS